jgi:diguanylate cyclase (GGDEF)-like protein
MSSTAAGLLDPRPSSRNATRAISDDRTIMMRSFALLWGAGSSLFLICLLLSPPTNATRPWMLALDAVGFSATAALATIGPRLPRWASDFVVLLGTGIITSIVLLSRSEASPYALYFFWLSVHASYFLPWKRAAMQLLYIALAYGAALVNVKTGAFPSVRWLMMMVTLAAVCTFVAVLRSRVDQLISRLADAATHDPLTGLLNRRALAEALTCDAGEGAPVAPISLVVGDVDNFKAINDHLGHLAGDEALQRMADVLRASVREGDIVVRLGGEEFGLVLPGATTEAATVVAERARIAIQDSFCGDPVPITISFGIAEYPTFCPSPASLLEMADAAMYVAKRTGRNRTVSAS